MIRTTKVLNNQNILFVTRDDVSYANQLRRRFPASREAQALQRGQYD